MSDIHILPTADEQMLAVIEVALDKLDTEMRPSGVYAQAEQIARQARVATWVAMEPGPSGRTKMARELDRLLALTYALRRELL